MFLLSNWGKFETNDLMEISEIMLRKSNDYSSSIVAEALVRSGNSVRNASQSIIFKAAHGIPPSSVPSERTELAGKRRPVR